MKGKNKNILFIGHDASVSGAPILLLYLLNLLKQEGGLNLFVVIKREGNLVDEYRRQFPVLVLKPKEYGREGNVLDRIRNIAVNKARMIYLFMKAAKADVVFSNTIVNGKLLKFLFPFKKKAITYVHELKSVIDQYFASGDSALTLKYSTYFAYPSLKVKQTLLTGYKIPANRLEHLSYYFPVDMNMINNTRAKQTFRDAFRAKFNITAEFVVGNIGVLCERKGTDLFIEVCERVVKQNPGIQFCWIGSFENPEIETELKKMVSEKNLSQNIVFTGPLSHHYYNSVGFDLFFLSSREDPYPLVVLEAALMNIPSVCFEGSGGIPEFVESDAGWVVPGNSLNEVSDIILQLFQHRGEISEKGENAMNKVLQRHTDSQVIINQFNKLINRV